MRGTCRDKHSARDPSTAVETPVSVPRGNNKNRVCRVKTRVLEGKTTRNMHKQGVGGGKGVMGQVCPKFGGRWWPVRQAGRTKVMVAKREKRRECDKTTTKKTTKKGKIRYQKKTTKKSFWSPRDLTYWPF